MRVLSSVLPVLLLGSIGGAALLSCVSPRSREVTAVPLRFGADVHLHPTLRESLSLYSGEPGSGDLATSPSQLLVNAIDPEGLRRAGVKLLFGTVFPPIELRPGRTPLGSAVHQLQALEAFARRRPDFAIVHEPEEVLPQLARGRIAVVPAIEGAEGIRRVEDVDVLYAAGVRVIQLVHFTDNAIADAEDDQFGPLLGLFLDGADGALSPLGEAAVARMIALGIVIDLSHASARTIAATLALTEAAGVPVLYSHAGAAMTRVRTLEDPLAARIAQGGGLIGIGVYRSDFLLETPEAERWPGFVARTCDEVIAHWRHYARVAGPDALVLGSDLGAPIDRPRPGGACPSGIRHAGDLLELFAALEAKGHPREALDSMGERVLTFWRRVRDRADPAAQQEAMRRSLPVDSLLDGKM